MSDDINFPTGFGMKDLVACGNNGMILLDKSTDTVIKSPTTMSLRMPSPRSNKYMSASSSAVATRPFSATTARSSRGSASSMLLTATFDRTLKTTPPMRKEESYGLYSLLRLSISSTNAALSMGTSMVSTFCLAEAST